MSKYKVLKSVAHNTGHSFLSDMNFVNPKTPIFVPEHLFETAIATASSTFQLDLLSGAIVPNEFNTDILRESAGYYRDFFLNQIEAQGSRAEMVHQAVLTVTFDLTRRRPAKYERGAVNPVFEALVQIVDDRGHIHIGRPVNWWRE